MSHSIPNCDAGLFAYMLVTWTSPAKTAELINMSFGEGWPCVEGAICGVIQFTEKQWESLPWCTQQKRIIQSSVKNMWCIFVIIFYFF